MAEKHWKERWEDESEAEYKAFCAMSVDALLDRIRNRQYGDYYMIWDAVAAKKDLARAGWTLYGTLQSPTTYLHRYHCAAALLKLLGCAKYEAADLTVEHRQPAKALAEVRTLLERKIGRRK